MKAIMFAVFWSLLVDFEPTLAASPLCQSRSDGQLVPNGANISDFWEPYTEKHGFSALFPFAADKNPFQSQPEYDNEDDHSQEFPDFPTPRYLMDDCESDEEIIVDSEEFSHYPTPLYFQDDSDSDEEIIVNSEGSNSDFGRNSTRQRTNRQRSHGRRRTQRSKKKPKIKIYGQYGGLSRYMLTDPGLGLTSVDAHPVKRRKSDVGKFSWGQRSGSHDYESSNYTSLASRLMQGNTYKNPIEFVDSDEEGPDLSCYKTMTPSDKPDELSPTFGTDPLPSFKYHDYVVRTKKERRNSKTSRNGSSKYKPRYYRS